MSKKENETSELEFSIETATEKEEKSYKKRGSIYDPVIDKILATPGKLLVVKVTGKSGNTLRTALKKRMVKREITDFEVSCVNQTVYAERKG